MHTIIGNAYQAFAAGAIGGFLQTIVIWLTSKIGVFALLQLPLSFDFNLVWFYQRITWGGLWGLLFLIPLMRNTPQWQRGLLFGLVPALASLLFFLPFKDAQGFFGLNLGVMMPVVVVAFGLVWGAITGALLDRAQPGADEEIS